jgi:hypothetical protein
MPSTKVILLNLLKSAVASGFEPHEQVMSIFTETLGHMLTTADCVGEAVPVGVVNSSTHSSRFP